MNAPIFTHEYVRLPQIHRKKIGIGTIRKREDENTEKYVLEDDNLRSAAGFDDEELGRGLEFTTIDEIEVKGELEEFIEILRLLEKKHSIKSVHISVGELSDGKKGKRFARLSDGITRRKYVIGRIIMIYGREFSLVEIERENRALSMLILKVERNVNWDKVYRNLLIRLVDASGTWSSELLSKIKAMGLHIQKVKHMNEVTFERKEKIYKKLN